MRHFSREQAPQSIAFPTHPKKQKFKVGRKLSYLLLTTFSVLLSIIFLWRGVGKARGETSEETPPALILSDAPSVPTDPDETFSINLNSAQEFDLSVYLYPQGKSIVAADLEMNFDPQVLEVLGKTDGNIFPTYIEPQTTGYLDAARGKIALSGIAFDQQSKAPSAEITQPGRLVRFRFKLKENLPSQVSQISFDPAVVSSQQNLTTDSNLVSLTGDSKTPQDVLGKVNSFKVIIEQPGDINGDSTVNLADFYLVAKSYGEASFERRADINRDGQVDLLDFYQIANNYGRTY